MKIGKILLHVQWKADDREMDEYACPSLREAFERINGFLENDQICAFQLSVDSDTVSPPVRLTLADQFHRGMEMERPANLPLAVDGSIKAGEGCSMKVEIDGVLYVPASQAKVGVQECVIALALQFDTPRGLAEYGHANLRVVVTDDQGAGGETLDEFAARLAAGEAR